MTPLTREISMKRVAIYLRVSTSNQDTDNQRRELEAVAEKATPIMTSLRSVVALPRIPTFTSSHDPTMVLGGVPRVPNAVYLFQAIDESRGGRRFRHVASC